MKTVITKDFLEKRNRIRKKPARKTMTGTQFFNAAVREANCNDINHLFKSIHTACNKIYNFFLFSLITFFFLVTGKSGPVNPSKTQKSQWLQNSGKWKSSGN
jgi:hypothetical protein